MCFPPSGDKSSVDCCYSNPVLVVILYLIIPECLVLNIFVWFDDWLSLPYFLHFEWSFIIQLIHFCFQQPNMGSVVWNSSGRTSKLFPRNMLIKWTYMDNLDYNQLETILYYSNQRKPRMANLGYNQLFKPKKNKVFLIKKDNSNARGRKRLF